MCVRHLAFVLLIWFPAVLLAQTAKPLCPALQLDHGYLVPKKQTYPHEKELIYACDEGYKPTAEGWWATSTCKNGQWSPNPQCIDETSCLPPTIPNANYKENPNGWYAEHRTITVKCDDGYELKDQSERIRCINGTWPSLPVCERSLYACNEPPQIPHAVIIKQEYQEVFGENSKVVYECQDRYTTDGIKTETSVHCSFGNWTETPSCYFFCVIEPSSYTRKSFEVTEVHYLKEGKNMNFRCPQYPGYYSNFGCMNGRISYTDCCHEDSINQGYCPYRY